MEEITVQINKAVFDQVRSELRKVLDTIEDGKRTGNISPSVADRLCSLLARLVQDIEKQLP